MSKRLLWSVGLGAAALGAGCGQTTDPNRPPLYPVEGVVRFNNEPVEGATVLFVPEEHEYAAAGRTDSNGQFRLMTFEEGDGAVEGTYQVTVRKFEFLYPPGGWRNRAIAITHKIRKPVGKRFHRRGERRGQRSDQPGSRW